MLSIILFHLIYKPFVQLPANMIQLLIFFVLLAHLLRVLIVLVIVLFITCLLFAGKVQLHNSLRWQ